MNRGRLGRAEAFLYILPATLFVGIFLLYPMVETAWLSLTRWDGLTPPVFTGLDNFVRLFGDPNFLNPLRNTAIWTVLGVAIPVALGFVFAYAITGVRGATFFRICIYVPATISATAAGVVFGFVLRDEGALNTLLTAVGLEALTVNWLYVRPYNTYAMIAAYSWQATGLNMMIFLVGLQNLPPEPIEAARIDGARGWTMARRIVMPMLTPYLVIATLLAVINGFKVFDTIWVMTGGGPARMSETLAVTMYREGFVMFRMGYAAAVAMVISAVAILFSWLYLRSVLRREAYT